MGHKAGRDPPISLIINGLRWPREIFVKPFSQRNSRAVTGRQCSPLDSWITTEINKRMLNGNDHFQLATAAQRGRHAELTYSEKAFKGRGGIWSWKQTKLCCNWARAGSACSVKRMTPLCYCWDSVHLWINALVKDIRRIQEIIICRLICRLESCVDSNFTLFSLCRVNKAIAGIQ